MLENLRSVGGGAPLASGGWENPQTPKLLLSLNLRITFEHCSDFSSSLKLRPIISYLSDGWAPLAKLALPPSPPPWLKPLVTPLVMGLDDPNWNENLWHFFFLKLFH